VRYGELFSLLEAGARRYGIVTDIADLELIVFEELQRLVDTYDLSAYLHPNPTMLRTAVGVDAYELPEDFGRLMRPIQETDWGLYRVEGTTRIPLQYREPIQWLTLDRSTRSRPTQFTLMEDQVWLHPTPDAAYTIEGLYVQRLERPDWEETVRLSEPSILLSKTLAVAAGTKHPDAALLVSRAEKDERTLAFHHARGRLRFWNQNKHDRLGQGYGRG
jgi:hypothetical protein